MTVLFNGILTSTDPVHVVAHISSRKLHTLEVKPTKHNLRPRSVNSNKTLKSWKESLLCICLSNTCQVLGNSGNHKHFICFPDYINERLKKHGEISGTYRLSSKTILKFDSVRPENISQGVFGEMSVLVEGSAKEATTSHTLLAKYSEASVLIHQERMCLSMQSQRVVYNLQTYFLIWPGVKQITLS